MRWHNIYERPITEEPCLVKLKDGTITTGIFSYSDIYEKWWFTHSCIDNDLCHIQHDYDYEDVECWEYLCTLDSYLQQE